MRTRRQQIDDLVEEMESEIDELKEKLTGRERQMAALQDQVDDLEAALAEKDTE